MSSDVLPITPAEMKPAEMEQAAVTSLQNEVTLEAHRHAPAAIKKLAALMKAKSTPPNVQRLCANDILAQAAGRPGMRDNRFGDANTAAGLTIVVQNYQDGQPTQQVVFGKAEEKPVTVLPIDEATRVLSAPAKEPTPVETE